MTGKFQDLIESTFALRENEGEDKVVDLREAVARSIRPGQKIHIAATHCSPGAAVLEIARQYSGQKPEFTLIMRGIRDTAVILVHLELAKKIITSFSGNVYPWYGPNAVCQKAYAEKKVELEDWTILTFPLRLMAGAFGVEAITTKSLIGSTMAERNRHAFTVIDDPFGSGNPIGLLQALHPDISIVHGLAADREGNTILTAPYSESVWGAKASRGGAIVTVERLVSTDFIRKHAHLVKLPACLVKSVSVVPQGAHPGGVWNAGLDTFEAYAEDYDFMTDFNRACKDPAALDTWIDRWVRQCPSFDDYRTKLGADRVRRLKEAARENAWLHRLHDLEDRISPAAPYNDIERMVIVASRVLQSRIPAEGHKTVLAGAGTANLAAWLAKYRLREEGYPVELLVELGYFGNSPRPAEPFLLNFENFATCKMLTETLDTLGVFTCGATNRCIGVLGAAQIDKDGNINSHWISDDLYITGSGGANDVATGARETLVVMQHSRERLLERVPFVTAPGNRVKTLVSTRGLFEKPAGGGEFILTGYFAEENRLREEILREIRETCGWPLKIAPDPVPIPPPTSEELRLLRIFDPQRFYLK